MYRESWTDTSQNQKKTWCQTNGRSKITQMWILYIHTVSSSTEVKQPIVIIIGDSSSLFLLAMLGLACHVVNVGKHPAK